jgi:hypothetical protein
MREDHNSFCDLRKFWEILKIAKDRRKMAFDRDFGGIFQ